MNWTGRLDNESKEPRNTATSRPEPRIKFHWVSSRSSMDPKPDSVEYIQERSFLLEPSLCLRSDADRVVFEMNPLEKLNFVKYVLSELSFRDQVRLFANADIIVDPHGTGLTNLIYSTDVNVVELLTSEVEPVRASSYYQMN